MEELENDSIGDQIVRTFESVQRMADAQQRFDEEVQRDLARLWADNAELRDELHALANRFEALLRARLAEPAEVAEKMVAPYPVCVCGHRFDRHRHHGVTACYEQDCKCVGYVERSERADAMMRRVEDLRG